MGSLLHLVKHLQLFQSPFVVPCPQRVGHLKHHRVQDRLRHRVMSDLRISEPGAKGGNFPISPPRADMEPPVMSMR